MASVAGVSNRVPKPDGRTTAGELVCAQSASCRELMMETLRPSDVHRRLREYRAVPSSVTRAGIQTLPAA